MNAPRSGLLALALLAVACEEAPGQPDATAAPAASDTMDTAPGTTDDAVDATSAHRGPHALPDDAGAPSEVTLALPMPLDALIARRVQGAVVWEPDHEYHAGEDLIVDWETYWSADPPAVPVVAPDTAEVVLAGSHYGLGTAIALRVDSLQLYVIYGHLDTVEAGIEVGAAVPRGGALGTVGTSGAAGPCPHIHLEVLPATSWDRPLSELGLADCGLTNPADVAPADALAQDSCFHYFSEGNALVSAIDAAFARPDASLRWPAPWAALSTGYPWVECVAACSAFCYDLTATQDGCERTAMETCPACAPITEDPRCVACPGPGCW